MPFFTFYNQPTFWVPIHLSLSLSFTLSRHQITSVSASCVVRCVCVFFFSSPPPSAISRSPGGGVNVLQGRDLGVAV
ncbi:hypothetical protein B0F90DRAFT_1763018, partial [Multifurca ochricompacta]